MLGKNGDIAGRIRGVEIQLDCQQPLEEISLTNNGAKIQLVPDVNRTKNLKENAVWRALLYLGMAILAGAFFVFYGGQIVGLQTPRMVFLTIAIVGFQLMAAGRILVASRKEAVLILVMDVAFGAAAISLIVYTGFSFGRWDYYVFMTLLFIAFVTGGFLPNKKIRTQDYGVTGALIASFFFEMFGFPLTLYLVDVFIGTNFPLQGRQGLEAAHLWVTFGFVTDTQAHFFSALLIIIGVTLVILGHRAIHAAKGGVVKSGIYRFLEHPQYTGIVIITGGMLVEYPTIPTLIMWFALIAMYVTRARRENQEIHLSTKIPGREDASPLGWTR